MQIDQYPGLTLKKFLELAVELANNKQVAKVQINQDRPVDIVDGKAKVTGPTVITISIECNYENG